MAPDDADVRGPAFLRWAVGAWVSSTVLQALFLSSPLGATLMRFLVGAVVLAWCVSLAFQPRLLRTDRADLDRWPLAARLRHEPLRHSWALPLAGVVMFASVALVDTSWSAAATASAFAVLTVVAPATRRRVRGALVERGAVADEPTSTAARHRRRRMRGLVVSTWLLATGLSIAWTETGRDDLGVAGIVGLSLAALGSLGLVLVTLMTLRGPDPAPLWYREDRPPTTG